MFEVTGVRLINSTHSPDCGLRPRAPVHAQAPAPRLARRPQLALAAGVCSASGSSGLWAHCALICGVKPLKVDKVKSKAEIVPGGTLGLKVVPLGPRSSNSQKSA